MTEISHLNNEWTVFSDDGVPVGPKDYVYDFHACKWGYIGDELPDADGKFWLTYDDETMRKVVATQIMMENYATQYMRNNR